MDSNIASRSHGPLKTVYTLIFLSVFMGRPPPSHELVCYECKADNDVNDDCTVPKTMVNCGLHSHCFTRTLRVHDGSNRRRSRGCLTCPENLQSPDPPYYPSVECSQPRCLLKRRNFTSDEDSSVNVTSEELTCLCSDNLCNADTECTCKVRSAKDALYENIMYIVFPLSFVWAIGFIYIGLHICFAHRKRLEEEAFECSDNLVAPTVLKD